MLTIAADDGDVMVWSFAPNVAGTSISTAE